MKITSALLLEEAFEKDPSLPSIEHVTNYLSSGRAPNLKQVHFKQTENHSFLRVTVDEESDFKLIEALIANYSANKLPALEIENLLIAHPELVALNQAVKQKKA